MSETVSGSDGEQIPLDSIAQTITWTGAFVTKITVVYNSKTYVQTFGNDGVNITTISGWIKQ